MTDTAAISPTATKPSVLLRVVDFLIAALVFVLPFIMGGREAWGHWFLISTAFLLGATWCTYAAVSGSRYAFSWLEYFFLAGLGIAWFQVQPHTATTLEQFSPEYGRLLAFWPQTQPTDASWSTLSLTPVETRHAFWVFVAYAIVGLVVFQRAKSVTDCERLLKWVGVSGLAMTVFGLWQWGLSNGKFFWLYEHPYTDTDVHLKGAFTNRNHFAQFLSLSIGPLLWWLVSHTKKILDGTASTNSHVFGAKKKNTGRRRELPPIKTNDSSIFDKTVTLPVIGLLAAVCVVGMGVVLSLSRGGMIAAGAVAFISVIGLWRGIKTGMGAVGVVVAGSALFLTLLTFADQEELQTKLDQLISSDADKIDTGGVRRAIWTADAKIIRQFPLLGTGVGSHRDVYPLYMDDYADFAMAEMTHAESTFVHIALETGLIGFGLLALGLLFVLGRMIIGCFRTNGTNQMCTVVVLACGIGGVLHGVVDFIWYAPAIVVTSLILLAVGLRTSSRNFGTFDAQPGLWFPRLAWVAMGGCCLLGLINVQANLFQRIDGEKHWYASLRTKLDLVSETDETEDSDDNEESLVSIEQEFEYEYKPEVIEPEDPVLVAKRIASQKKFLVQRIQHLTASMKACPNQHRVQQALSEQAIKLFDILQIDADNSFSLSMLRDASSGFETVEDLHTWLNNNCDGRANLLVLANKLSKQSLTVCPVQGYAYLSLMQTTFIEGNNKPAAQDYTEQALLVRGHDPRIRLAAGKEALVAGDQKTALELFQTVFHSNQRFRLDIIQQWASGARAEFFLQQFKPNGEELEDLLIVYDYLNREQDSAAVLRQLMQVLPKEAPAIEDEDERLEVMMKAFVAAERLEELEPAVQILEHTIAEFPFAFAPRYCLGRTLVLLERGEEAMEHLNWCYDQDPAHIHLQNLIQQATKLKHAIPEMADARLSRL